MYFAPLTINNFLNVFIKDNVDILLHTSNTGKDHSLYFLEVLLKIKIKWEKSDVSPSLKLLVEAKRLKAIFSLPLDLQNSISEKICKTNYLIILKQQLKQQ